MASGDQRRTCIAVAVTAAALVLGACGSKSSSPAPAQISPAGDQVAAAPAAPASDAATAAAPDPTVEAATLDRKLAAAERRARRHEAARADHEIAKLEREHTKALARHDAATAKATAGALAEAMGYSAPAVALADDGRTLTVGVTAQDACVAPASGPESLAERLRTALPFVKHSAVTVGGQSLDGYTRAGCAWGHLPAAAAVASAAGTGEQEVQAFRVGRGTWTVDYGTSGRFLQVLVLQDAQILAGSAVQHGAGGGHATFEGPGTFTLRVAGDGRWAVQVRRAAG